MNRLALAAAAAAALSAAGCTSYHPSSLSHAPYGPSAVHGRVVADPSLAQRYPVRADIAEARYPEGARTPLPRPAGEAWGVAAKPGYVQTPLERAAERRSIARDLPHASVTPWGTAKGY
jgi:hypothetical protein